MIEPECMRRLLPVAEWRTWFDAFLPALAESQPNCLFQPVPVSDRSDGKIVHLDGLNLSRAWCWRGLGSGLPSDDPRRALAETAAADHILQRDVFEREAIPYEAAFLVGKCFSAYRRRGGARSFPIPDFFVGAHAAVAGYRLLTRDTARYRTYFPELALIAPE